MKKLIECVPNFSEGRDESIINAIADAIRNTKDVRLLDVDPGKSTNRTVYTFIGDENSVVEGALNAARVAYKLIDMRNQKGEHPRMGALDVCPFVPVANVTMEECVDCSKRFAEAISKELNIPLYLYEAASKIDYRKSLPDIRHGEYEGFETKILDPRWKPDYGPAEFVPSWGATVTGARNFLIAYNVNLLATNNQAHRIALNLREAGRGEAEPGALKEVKAIGWHVEEYGMAQVSMNLTNFDVTPVHIAYESVKHDAEALNIALAGSELVGLIPLKAMLEAAEYYIKKEKLFILEEHQKIRLVIERLGLNSISNFNPKKRIIEYLIAEEQNLPLANLTVSNFIHAVAARTSAPGGGSVAALIASVGVALNNMVAWLTYGVRKFEGVQHSMQEALPGLYHAYSDLISMIDADTNAFNDYIDAVRLPKGTEEEIATRDIAMQKGLKKAVEVPLLMMKKASRVWNQLEIVAHHGNIASKSDMEVGIRAIELGIWGAQRNVMINLAQITDESYKSKIAQEANEIADLAKRECERLLGILSERS